MTQEQTQTPLDELATALALFQAEMPSVAKTQTATVRSEKGSFSYTYAGLAEVTKAAMPLLAKHGLAFVTLPGHGVLTGMLLHSSGQALVATLPITGNTPQQVGSSLTYMRRYLLGCMTGLVTEDDDDGQQAQAAARKRPAPKTGDAPDPTTSKTVRTRRARQDLEASAQPVPLPPDPWLAPEQPPEPPVAPAPVSPSRQAPQVPPGGPGSGPITGPQRARLMASCSRIGIDPDTDRTMRLALFSALLARPVETTKQLTTGDCNTLLRYLNDIETGALEWDYLVPQNVVRLRWAENR